MMFKLDITIIREREIVDTAGPSPKLGYLYLTKINLTWPQHSLDSVNEDSQGDEGVQMDVKAIGPLHWSVFNRVFHEHIVADDPGKKTQHRNAESQRLEVGLDDALPHE